MEMFFPHVGHVPPPVFSARLIRLVRTANTRACSVFIELPWAVRVSGTARKSLLPRPVATILLPYRGMGQKAVESSKLPLLYLAVHSGTSHPGNIMKLRGIAVALFLLISVPTLAQITHIEANTAPHQEVEAALPASHPSVLYYYAARLFNEGKRDEAVFWFYAGQLRYRYHLAAFPDLPPDQDPAVMASLNAAIGQVINEWAGADPAGWAKAMDHALAWDAAHDNPTTPKNSHAQALQETREGLAGLRDNVIANADEIRQERKAAGLPVR